PAIAAAWGTLPGVAVAVGGLRMFHHHAAAITTPMGSAASTTQRPRRARSSGKGRTLRAGGTASTLAWRFSRSLSTWLIRLIVLTTMHRGRQPQRLVSDSTPTHDAPGSPLAYPA